MTCYICFFNYEKNLIIFEESLCSETSQLFPLKDFFNYEKNLIIFEESLYLQIIFQLNLMNLCFQQL